MAVGEDGLVSGEDAPGLDTADGDGEELRDMVER